MDAALIIASGRTGKNKALEPLLEAGGLTVEQRLVLLLQRAGVKKIYVISHTEKHELEKTLAKFGVTFLENPEPNPEMIHNIQYGLKEMPENCSRVLITPNDVAFCQSESIQKLLESKADAAVASCRGRGGHPLLLSRKLWPWVLRFKGSGGLRAALREAGLQPEKVETDDPGVLWSQEADDEVPERLLETSELSHLRPVVRVMLAKEEIFFGPGPQQLLEIVAESSHFREACQKMGISYSKGWKIVEKAETALGCTLVERSKGGSERGSSKLSPEGRRLLERYALFRHKTEEAAEEIFEDLFTRPLTDEDE